MNWWDRWQTAINIKFIFDFGLAEKTTWKNVWNHEFIGLEKKRIACRHKLLRADILIEVTMIERNIYVFDLIPITDASVCVKFHADSVVWLHNCTSIPNKTFTFDFTLLSKATLDAQSEIS